MAMVEKSRARESMFGHERKKREFHSLSPVRFLRVLCESIVSYKCLEWVVSSMNSTKWYPYTIVDLNLLYPILPLLSFILFIIS